MNTTSFIILLSAFSVISGLVTEGIKNIVIDKDNRCYNIIALCVALVIGFAGTIIFYKLNYISYTSNNIIVAVLMGLASGLCSMVGYDKVKQAISQLIGE